MMRILIDADGCPVVDDTIKIAKEYHIETLIICDTSHEFYRENIETITVSKGADTVDFVLVNLVQKGDIIVTQDYGLAAMCMAREAVPIDQNGRVYTEENIDALLLSRHTARKIRNAGGRLKGSAKRKKEQDRDFEIALRSLLISSCK